MTPKWQPTLPETAMPAGPCGSDQPQYKVDMMIPMIFERAVEGLREGRVQRSSLMDYISSRAVLTVHDSKVRIGISICYETAELVCNIIFFLFI